MFLLIATTPGANGVNSAPDTPAQAAPHQAAPTDASRMTLAPAFCTHSLHFVYSGIQ